MKYFLLKYQYKDSGFIDGDVKFIPDLLDYYNAGVSDIKDLDSVEVIMDSKVKKLRADFFHTGSGAFFGSDCFAKTTQNLQTNVEIIRAKVSYFKKTPVEKSYYLIHATEKIDCFDYEKSDYPGKSLVLQGLNAPGGKRILVKGIKNICIKSSLAPNKNYFFLDSVAVFQPVISEMLLDALLSEKLKVEYAAIDSVD